MNDTPQGDGNKFSISIALISPIIPIRMNDTQQGDGNVSINSFFKAKSNIIRMNDTP